MSVTELPPIGNRPGSSKSRRSSRDSSSGGPVRNSVIKYEKPPLISVDHNGLLENGVNMINNRTAIKRSHLSPGSNGSSSPSQPGSFPSTQPSNPSAGGLSRAKSWCATEANAGPNPRLETLFERNGVIKQKEIIRHNSGESSTEEPRNENVMTKPPRGRLRSQGAMGSTNTPLQTVKRSLSNSISNLSKLSDTKDTAISQNTKPLRNNINPSLGPRAKTNLYNSHKFKSETNLTSSNAGYVTSRMERNNHINKLPPSQGNRLNHDTIHGKSKPMLKSVRSQPVFNNLKNNASEGRLTSQTLKTIEKQSESEADGSDSDNEKNVRIVQWLMAVGDERERPHTPNIVEDIPPQTDTAIHIVYDKD